MDISIALLQVGDDEWNFAYLIHSRNDRSNIVPTLGFELQTSYILHARRWLWSPTRNRDVTFTPSTPPDPEA